jgi:hypothetical protein
MSENTIPQEILIITGSARPSDSVREPRRGEPIPSRLLKTTNIDIANLRGQVNIFLQQMNQVLNETPAEVEGFRLDQFEVSAGIVVEARGEVKLALIADVEAGGGINAGLKFVFKRS